MWFCLIVLGFLILVNFLPKRLGDRVFNTAGVVLFWILFAALSWWLMRQSTLFILQILARAMGRETKAAQRLAEFGHHTTLDLIALIVGLICGIVVALLQDDMRSMLLGPGVLILFGVTIVLYLINRYISATRMPVGGDSEVIPYVVSQVDSLPWAAGSGFSLKSAV